ncbi:MAG: FAD binding domain-containing protein [Deltaproteobacteria bacterium]|nr:FAD binding domain-containing protein [Deltaproteobacteria bacterium]
MPEVEALHRPRSLDEALDLMAQHGERARPLAGGTTVALARGGRRDVVVALARAGLDAIEQGPDGLRIGAMASCAALAKGLAGSPSALSDAAAVVGTRVLRNHVTIGGNCCVVYAWSDLPVALRALGASFELASAGGRRRVLPEEAFFAQQPSRVMAAGELLVAILLPAPAPGSGSAFVKLARNAGDHASASVAARVELDGGIVRSARLVAGGVKGMPQVLAGAAAALAGCRAEEALEEAARVAESEVDSTSDFRGGAEWRKHVVGVLVGDAVRTAIDRAIRMGA